MAEGKPVEHVLSDLDCCLNTNALETQGQSWLRSTRQVLAVLDCYPDFAVRTRLLAKRMTQTASCCQNVAGFDAKPVTSRLAKTRLAVAKLSGIDHFRIRICTDSAIASETVTKGSQVRCLTLDDRL